MAPTSLGAKAKSSMSPTRSFGNYSFSSLSPPILPLHPCSRHTRIPAFLRTHGHISASGPLRMPFPHPEMLFSFGLPRTEASAHITSHYLCREAFPDHHCHLCRVSLESSPLFHHRVLFCDPKQNVNSTRTQIFVCLFTVVGCRSINTFPFIFPDCTFSCISYKFLYVKRTSV